MKKRYQVGVSVHETAYIVVHAENEEEAKRLAYDKVSAMHIGLDMIDEKETDVIDI